MCECVCACVYICYICINFNTPHALFSHFVTCLKNGTMKCFYLLSVFILSVGAQTFALYHNLPANTNPLSFSQRTELTIPATGNVFYAMSSASVDFLLRRRGGKTPVGSPSLNDETSATFPRIKAKGRRLVRTLF